MENSFDKIRKTLDSIQSRIEDMCREMCEKDGLSYEKEFGSNYAKDGIEDGKTIEVSCEVADTGDEDDSSNSTDEIAAPEPVADDAGKDDVEDDDEVSEEDVAKNAEYVEEFKKHFGYKDDYYPSTGYDEASDSIAREYTLELPTDTEAQETEGDAVMLLVSSNSKNAVKAGKKLGDIMMKKTEGGNGKDNENLLDAMRDAYLELRTLASKEECEKNSAVESFGGVSLYSRAKSIFEAIHGINEDGSDFGFSDYITESIIESKTTSDWHEELNESESTSLFGARMVVNESSKDDFDKRIDDWVNKDKRDKSKLEIIGNEEPDERKFKERMGKILKLDNKRNLAFDNLDDGERSSVSDWDKSHVQDDRFFRGDEDSTEGAFKRGLKQVGAGINNYLNKFIPMSWILGTERAVGKGINKVLDKTMIGPVYKALGGNKALALGTLGGLTFGPAGAVAGVGLGKGLQKVADFGNGVKSSGALRNLIKKGVKTAAKLI